MFIGMSVSSFPPPAPAAAFPDGDVLIGITGDSDDHGDDGAAASGGVALEVSPVFGSLVGLLPALCSGRRHWGV